MTDRVMVVYHSADLDGKCAGYIVGKAWGPFAVFYGMDYGEEFDVDVVRALGVTRVVMVDFSLPPAQMDALNREFEFTWIDHHKTAIEACSHLRIPGLRRIGVAGCELAWMYYYSPSIPEAVQWIGRYDVWDHSDPCTIPFQYALKGLNLSPRNTEQWEAIINSGQLRDALLAKGMAIVEYKNQTDAAYVRNLGFWCSIAGCTALACNMGQTNSLAFASFSNPEIEVFVAFVWAAKLRKWRVSLYTNGSVDVSEIAKLYGGGGHAGAAGFLCSRDELWQILEVDGD